MNKKGGKIDDLVEGLKKNMPVPRKPKVRAQTREAKPRKASKVSPYDLCHYWATKFSQKFPGIRKDGAKPLGKHLKLMSLLLEEFEVETLRKMIGWFIHNAQSLPKYNGAPTIEGLYAWRATVVLSMEGKIKPQGRKDTAHKRDSSKNSGVARL